MELVRQRVQRGLELGIHSRDGGCAVAACPCRRDLGLAFRIARRAITRHAILHRLPVAAAFAGEDAAEGEAGEVGGGHEGAV